MPPPRRASASWSTNMTTEAKTLGEYVEYVPDHGTFRAPVLVYLACKRRSRASLVASLLSIYEGCDAHGGKGNKASHWRGYAKSMLAIIVADCLGGE